MATPIRMLGVRAAARELGVHENTIRNWESRGILKAVRLPYSGYRRFDADQIERLRREMFARPAPAETGRTAEHGE